ncbi:SMAD/FHA domain-containing protein [Polychytrium aggregatum]|uniref:SMAD/FHA domain-containing protein n=1 Tax=Polychytrium aggregatum TaxID=110093 RepID=UPI0022FE58D0|nr:SMAD/FHA domain-containing protein [Polychytrium aggregatum]KAI9202086.1 SMAD/FHA domain-containing protein [Polychytrium aggregatum]
MPDYKPSGLLGADQNTFKGVVLKYSEPIEARKPTARYRLYVFKGEEQIDLLHIHRQSAYLIGRDRVVADIPIDHPSCSKQHAALQYRQIVTTDELGQTQRTVKPYIIDLNSTNGVMVNGDRIPASRYVELRSGDTIKFGQSSRDYVLLTDDE